jgi:hypothetical protein
MTYSEWLAPRSPVVVARKLRATRSAVLIQSGPVILHQNFAASARIAYALIMID